MINMQTKSCYNFGFALTELIFVIALISILLGMATIGYNQWIAKNKVETQVKEMVSDFSELRIRAMTRKQRHSITVNRDNYVFKSYSSDDEPLTSGTPIPPATATVPTRKVYVPLKSDSSTFYNGTIFEIDHRGMFLNSLGGTIYLDNITSGASLDCLTLHVIRINPGKNNSAWSNCDDK